jgi:hypothetical protein
MKQNEKIKATIKTFGGKVKTFLATMTLCLLFGLTGCNKDTNYKPKDPNNPTIKQQFGMTISAQQMRLKSFDPNSYIVPLSTDIANLILVNKTNPSIFYSAPITAQDLKDGKVVLAIVPGIYDISFSSPHGENVFKQTMDISINEPNRDLQGTPITLSAVLEDFLIVYDVVPNTPTLDNMADPNFVDFQRWYALGYYIRQGTTIHDPIAPVVLESVRSTIDNSPMVKENDYWLGYAKDQTELKLCFSTYTMPIHTSTTGQDLPAYTITPVIPVNQVVKDPLVKGILYWLLKGFSGTFELSIPELILEKIIVTG